MTISSSVSRVDYTGNGSVATYSFTFRVFSSGDLTVTVVSTAGVETTLTLTTDYTVTLNNNGTGSITLVDADQAWLTGANLTSGYGLTIRRVVDITQESSFANQTSFHAATHEAAFDKGVMISQQQQDELDRTIKGAETDGLDAEDYVLPTVAERAEKYLYFDEDGIPTAAAAVDASLVAISSYGETLVDDANAATARATLGGLTKVVATKAALKALSGTDLTGTVFIQAFATAGDGGHGYFYWASASSATDNVGTIIQPDAGGTGRWLRLYHDTIQPEWFGAVGDGSTNDATAMNACLGMLEAGTARRILLSKQYGLGATSWTGIDLTSATDVEICGTGWKSGFKQLAAPSQNIQSLTTFFLVDTCTRVKLSNFKIDLNALEHCGIGVKGSTDVALENIFITNSPNTVEGDNRPAYQWHTTTRGSMRGCRATSVSAWFAIGALSSTSQSNDFVMEGCEFTSSASTNSINCNRCVIKGNVFNGQARTAGVTIEAAGTTGGAMTDWVIADNIFRDCSGGGLQLTPAGGTNSIAYGVVKGNVFMGTGANASVGISFFGGVDHVTIADNVVYNFDKGIASGVTAAGGFSNIVITGNNVYDTRSAGDRTMRRGIEITLSDSGGLTGVYGKNVLVKGNLVRNMTEFGIWCTRDSGDATFKNIVFSGNIVTDCSDRGLAFATAADAYDGVLVEGNLCSDNTTADVRFSLTDGDGAKVLCANNLFRSTTKIEVGGSGYAPLILGHFGTGSPDNVEFGRVGSTFHRIDGSTSTSIYIKTSGNNDDQTWTAK